MAPTLALGFALGVKKTPSSGGVHFLDFLARATGQLTPDQIFNDHNLGAGQGGTGILTLSCCYNNAGAPYSVAQVQAAMGGNSWFNKSANAVLTAAYQSQFVVGFTIYVIKAVAADDYGLIVVGNRHASCKEQSTTVLPPAAVQPCRW